MSDTAAQAFPQCITPGGPVPPAGDLTSPVGDLTSPGGDPSMAHWADAMAKSWPASGGQATPPAAYPAYPQYVPAPKKQYVIDGADSVAALAALVFGFLTWHWLWPESGAAAGGAPSVLYLPGVAVTLFFGLAVVGSLAYLARRGVGTRAGVVGAVAILVAAVPFTLYAPTPLHVIAGLVLVVVVVIWVGYAAGTAVAPWPGAASLVDAVNQGFVVPFTGLGAWFAGLRAMTRNRRGASQVLMAAIGVVVALPVIILVGYLLRSSNPVFDAWMAGFGRAFTHLNLGAIVLQFAFGVPVAIYVFALLYGNARRSAPGMVSLDGARRAAQAVRKVPTGALAAPVIVLIVLYLVFFAAMGSYLFSAFAGILPAATTYAEYARQGFFQLTAVAVINLVALAGAHLFARREGPLPALIRALGGILSGLTLLLVAVASSKMWLYIGARGLTHMRLYTLWLEAVLAVVFVLLLAWHIRSFRVGRPIVGVAVLGLFALLWANPDGIIANHNVDAYLSGDLATVDTELLASLSDATVPALVRLRDQAVDPAVSQDAATALMDHIWRSATMGQAGAQAPWTAWNWQSWQANRLMTDR